MASAAGIPTHRGHRRSDVLAVLTAVALVVGLTALHAWTLASTRDRGPLSVDEANYLALSAVATAPVHEGSTLSGPILLWTSSASGPLLPEVTVVGHLLFGRTVTVGLLSNLVFFVLLAVATWLLARRWLSQWWAVAALALVLTAPGVAAFTQTYVFALAPAAAWTAALVCLLRSRGLTRPGWSAAFGVAVGATVLARTVMVAFVPALLAAALVVWLQHRSASAHPTGQADGSDAPTPRPWLGPLAAGVGLLVTAGSWLAFALGDVLDYLLDYGYGESSSRYGATSVASAAFWLADVVDLTGRQLHLPLAVLLGGGAVAGAWAARDDDPDTWWRRVGRSGLLAPVVAVATGLLALLTSRNTGYGFTLPLVPAAVVVAVALIRRIPAARARTAVTGGALALAVVATVALTGLVPALTGPHVVWSGEAGALALVDGRSPMAVYIATDPGRPATDDGQVPAGDAGWLPAIEAVVAALRAAPEGPPSTTLVAVEGPLFNLNGLALADALAVEDGEDLLPMRPLGTATTDGAGALRPPLDEVATTGPVALVTGPASLSWGGDAADPDALADAATAAGFSPVATVPLPYGDEVTVWVRPPAG